MPLSLSARLSALQRQTGNTEPQHERLTSRVGQSSTLSRLAQQRARKKVSLLGKLQAHLGVPAGNRGFIELRFNATYEQAGLDVPAPAELSGPPWSGQTATNRLVFIDTETTGLSGGSGTKVFQIGICWYERDEIAVYQSLLTEPAAEQEFLQAFVDAVPDDAVLVSYNGKSFDLPLLATRLRLNRLHNPLLAMPHVDLLYSVRRAYRKSWSQCTLKMAESRLLGVNRVDDLPGAMAPEAWKAFVLGHAYRPVAEVLTHNKQDILSLAGLAVVLTEVFQNPEQYGADLCAVSRVWRDHDLTKAEAILRRCADDDFEARLQLAEHVRQQQGYGAALGLWHDLATKHRCTVSLRRLAIYYEHYKKDPAAAHHFAAQLVMLECKQEHEHRLSRLVANLR